MLWMKCTCRKKTHLCAHVGHGNTLKKSLVKQCQSLLKQPSRNTVVWRAATKGINMRDKATAPPPPFTARPSSMPRQNECPTEDENYLITTNQTKTKEINLACPPCRDKKQRLSLIFLCLHKHGKQWGHMQEHSKANQSSLQNLFF